MTYHFRVTPPAERAVVAIEGRDAEGPMIAAAFAGGGSALTDANLLRAFIAQPLLARAGARRDPLGGAEALAQGGAVARQAAAAGGGGERGARRFRCDDGKHELNAGNDAAAVTVRCPGAAACASGHCGRSASGCAAAR